MTEPCRRLPWDSDFFGFPIAQVNDRWMDLESARAVDAWCRQNEIRCVYFLADANDPVTTAAAEQAGFHLADVRLAMELRPLACSPAHLPDRLAIRPAGPADVPTLQHLASRLYTLSRFYFDPGFPRQRCQDLYALWIEKNCTEQNNLTLIAELQGRAVGFISASWTPETRQAKIGLLGVAAGMRQQGYGLFLMQHCLAELANQGIQEVEAVTQMRNIGAQRVNQRAGFITSNVQIWYHKWF